MNPCKIRINNEDHSKAVQEYLFEQGCRWNTLGNCVGYQDSDYLFVGTIFEGEITMGDTQGYFDRHKSPELDLSHLDPHLKPKGNPMNSLALLRQAQEHLLEAENAYENATFELEKAKEGYRVALEAFKEEAKGILGTSSASVLGSTGDSEETSEKTPQGDMSDPRNWLHGDILECISEDSISHLTVGNLYKPGRDNSVYPYIIDDGGHEQCGCLGSRKQCFKWHSRPVK